MNAVSEPHSVWHRIGRAYMTGLKALVYALVVVSGICVFVMIGVICADVILRRFGHPIKGAYDIVKIAGAMTLASALPYTTAVKGHVAIEYFFHKLSRLGRVIVDSVVRLMGIGLFAFLSWRSIVYGMELRTNRQVAQTLEMPIFWVPWIIGFCCFVVILVIVYNLTHPRREMIKP